MDRNHEKENARKERLSSFFFNLAQLAFAGLVIGWLSPISDNAGTQNVLVLIGGISFTVIFALVGNNIMK